MHLSKVAALAAFFATGTLAAPAEEAQPGFSRLERRAVEVAHDSLNALAQNLDNSATSNAIKKLQPSLYIESGCQPYPAIDTSGDWSGGLNPSGSASGGCRDLTKAQVYQRGGWHNGVYGILYTWYMPKDQGGGNTGITGHRHDWEGVVVWVNNPAASIPKVLGIATSAHGKYVKEAGAFKNTMPGTTHPTVKYYQDTAFFGTHSIHTTGNEGRYQPIIGWDFMNDNMRKALNTVNWGSANCPISNGNFANNLAKAAL
ncbi:necrosis and ethylene-inducing protein 1 precursor [Dactylonectria macrodidyma]|uniref:Necrosis and ethylene-inducing protein 1 n=1 Tax=Dactylonectria macrodidyma TaxID=307937 RepID=A0A9P9EQL3_9HYPO|nr:necrosis and ethylene-inducing protein 1 precursor [Dactylonectria macrodidyma]